MDLTFREASELQKRIKERRRKQCKQSIAKESPLKHTIDPTSQPDCKPGLSSYAYIKRWRKSEPATTNSDEESKLVEIQEQLESVSKLPRTSKYAQHRLKVLLTTHELLQLGKDRSCTQQKELERLLSSLAL